MQVPMPHKVFFAFNYDRDLWRATQVHNSNVFVEASGLPDEKEWRHIRSGGSSGVQKWINQQLVGTDATVVLINSDTTDNEWVHYAIAQSYRNGNGLLGILINHIPDQSGNIEKKGKNPFDYVKYPDGTPLSYYVALYDWVVNDGKKNLVPWIEKARQQRQLQLLP